MIAILLMVALAMAGVVAAGIALLLILRRFAPRALRVIAVLGAAGVWVSLAGLGVTWMTSGLSAEAVVLSAAAATLSAAVAANAWCWWLSARTGWIASGVTAAVATLVVALVVGFGWSLSGLGGAVASGSSPVGWIPVAFSAALGIAPLVLVAARSGLVDLDFLDSGGPSLVGGVIVAGLAVAALVALSLLFGTAGALWLAIALGLALAVVVIGSVVDI